MPEIIVRGGDDTPRPLLPNHEGETTHYDPRVAQDHTGIKFNARARRGYKTGDPLTDCTVLMVAPNFVQCPGDGCGSREFRIIADDSHHASGGLVQFVCARPGCQTFWPILQMGQPQVNDALARRAGLIVPDAPTMSALEVLLGGDDD